MFIYYSDLFIVLVLMCGIVIYIVGTALDNSSEDDIGPQELTPVEPLMSVGQGKSTPLVVDNGGNSLGGAWEPIDPSQLPIDVQLSIRC